MINEFRQDLVSGEWVLFATGRAKRPGEKKATPKTAGQSKEKCPFEDPEKFGNEILVTYPAIKTDSGQNTDWFAKVAKNKFPAVIEGEAGERRIVGPFKATDAKGLHEVVIYRDHEKEIYDFSADELTRVFEVYQDRYKAMASYSASKYILIFHNRGMAAGASIAHPHSQIISIPILPPDVKRSVQGSQDFYDENGKRVYDLMINWELEQKKRIVCENEHFVAFCPFVSKTPYEIRIFGKESHAHFEQCPIELLTKLGEVMRVALRKLKIVLEDPDFNFFVHTAPVDAKTSHIHEFYSWHVEIIPKVSMTGAFELGSGIDVNIIDPDQAAEELRTADPS